MNKIDFAVVLSADGCNPNGDPVNGNIPRINYDGYGEMSTVCIKRKMRNRMEMLGHEILLSNDPNNELHSVSARVKAANLSNKISEAEYKKIACEKWMDVRAFGQLFAFKHRGSEKGKGVSISVRGPVSVTLAASVATVELQQMTVTGSVNREKNQDERDNTTMGMKYYIRKAAYVFYGAISPQLAELTGFSEEDVKVIKEILCTLFVGDESESRPAGSMAVQEVYWWEHNCQAGQYSSAVVHHSLHLQPQDTYPFFSSKLDELPNLTPEIIKA